jgi:hypothetical protein
MARKALARARRGEGPRLLRGWPRGGACVAHSHIEMEATLEPGLGAHGAIPGAELAQVVALIDAIHIFGRTLGHPRLTCAQKDRWAPQGARLRPNAVVDALHNAIGGRNGIGSYHMGCVAAKGRLGCVCVTQDLPRLVRRAHDRVE